MNKEYFAKIIAKDVQSLQIISACCSKAKIKISDIKYLKKNKIFLFSMRRISKEDKINKEINSICKFEYVDMVKSINIDQKNLDRILELITIEPFKMNQNYNITLLFKNNEIITLNTEIIEATLEDQNK